MLREKWFLMDATDDPAPAGGGAPAAPASTGSDVDWEKESAPDDYSEVVEPVTPAKADSTATPAPTPVAEPAAPAPAPSTATPPTPPAAAPVAATPPTPSVPPAAGATPAPAAPAEPTPSAPSQQPDIAALRAQEVARLTTQYALSEDQARGVLVEPEKHLPGMLASMHVNIADAVIHAVMDNLPRMVTNLTQQTTEAQRSESEFYGMWPALREAAGKSKDHEKVVINAITTYRQLNPKAPKDEIMRAAGLQAMIMLRLPLPPDLFATPAPSPQLAPGFQHAAPGAGGGPIPAKPDQNPFQLLNSELDEEERNG